MFDTLGEVDVSNTGMDYNLQKHLVKPAATANHGTQNKMVFLDFITAATGVLSRKYFLHSQAC